MEIGNSLEEARRGLVDRYCYYVWTSIIPNLTRHSYGRKVIVTERVKREEGHIARICCDLRDEGTVRFGVEDKFDRARLESILV